MTDTVSTTARIRVTLEVDWPHSFGGDATARDIYTTAARECRVLLESALQKSGISYRLMGEIEPLMVIRPARKP